MSAAGSQHPAGPWGTYGIRGWRGWWLVRCHRMPVRRLALWMRKILKGRIGDWADVEVWGLRLRLATVGNLSEQRMVFMPQHLDRREREVLAETLCDGGAFFDIGANVGAYSLWVASLGIEGVQVEAFEPDPALAARLQGNLAENGLGSVHVNRYALGREDGELVLVRGVENLGENEVRPDGEGERVPVRRLASVLEEKDYERIEALKIDVEGHEAEILVPFLAEVERERWPRVIVCECLKGSVETEAAAVLLESGYELVERTRMNGIFRLRKEGGGHG